MSLCTNHTWIETNRTCPDCGHPYCDQCLVEFLGQLYCGPCRDRRLYQMQNPAAPGAVVGGYAPLAGTGEVDLGGWLSAGWQIIQADLGAFLLAGFVGGVISIGSCSICTGAMMCGMYMMAFRKLTHGTVEFGNLFDGFRRMGWALLTVIVVAVLSNIAPTLFMIPAQIVQSTNPQNTGLFLTLAVIAYALGFAVSCVVSGATIFAIPHVAARNANAGEALAASFAVFRRNPLMFTLMGLVFGLIPIASCIFIFLTMPLVMAATAKAYADHFGIEGWDRV